MKNNMNTIFRINFLLGLFLLFISLFFSWISFQVYDINHNIVASWNYNIFTEWSTPLSCCQEVNELLRPEELAVPIAINILFIIFIISTGYITISKNLDGNTVLEKIHYYIGIYVFLFLLNLYYCIIFPLFYMLPKGYYYPFIEYEDSLTHLLYRYSIGPGYLLQLVALVLIFPYIGFFTFTITKFEKERRNPNMILAQRIKETKEPLNLDRLIAEEMNHLDLNKRRIMKNEL